VIKRDAKNDLNLSLFRPKQNDTFAFMITYIPLMKVK
jgi:hypothetical protein